MDISNNQEPRLKRQRAVLTKLAGLAGAVLVLAATPFQTHASEAGAADSYPAKPISMIVSYPPGGSVDAAGRILQDPLSKTLGQTVVIENKGGAGGTIGTRYVASAKPDGYTMLLTLSSHTINPAIYTSLPFDTEKDLIAVSLVASAPQVLVANPKFPVKSIDQLIKYVKGSGEEIPYGSAGIGSPSHIAGELFRLKTGLKLTHIAYRGGGPATVDVLGGQIPLLWVSLPSVTQHIASGALNALAVSTAKRTPILPDVPSIAETIDGFNVDSWYGMFAPAGTPAAIVAKMQKAIAQASQDKRIQEAFNAIGAVVVGSPPDELEAIVKREVVMWKALAKEANIKVN